MTQNEAITSFHVLDRMGAAQMDFLKSGYRVARETLRDAMDDKPVFWTGVVMGIGVVLGLLV